MYLLCHSSYFDEVMRSPCGASASLCFPLQELSSQLESLGKVDSASFQASVAALAQQDLAAAEQPDLEQYLGRLQTWEAENRHLIEREKEMRVKAEQEKLERLAANVAAWQQEAAGVGTRDR